MKLLLIGAGGHCLSCINVMEHGSEFSVGGIVDRDGSTVSSAFGYPVVGTDRHLPRLLRAHEGVLITIGQLADPRPRRDIFSRLEDLGATFVTVCASDSAVSARAEVGLGTVVLGKASIGPEVFVGHNCIINSHALVEHGTTIGDHCHVSTGVVVNGDVTIEDSSFVGSGSVIREGVRIGRGSVIGAGSVVGRDVPPGTRIPSRWSHSS